MSEGSSSTDTSRIVFDLEAEEAFLMDLARFLSDLSLVETGNAFRLCSVFEADNSGES